MQTRTLPFSTAADTVKNREGSERGSRLLLFVCIALVGALLAPQRSASAGDAILYVDRAHPNASDLNPGTPAAPLLTIQRAADLAVENKSTEVSTLVHILPGVYREFVDLRTYTNFPTNDPDNAATIEFSAVVPGSVIVSGAERFAEWRVLGAGVWVHDWPHDWGVAPDPTGGQAPPEEIVLRREIVFVDDVRLTQVLSFADLKVGAYYVDEATDELFIMPPAGGLATTTAVEVGVREHLWWQEYENHVTLRGLVFERAATHWEDAHAAVRISGSANGLVEDCVVRWNNGLGLYAGETDDLVLRRVEMNDNGWDGWAVWRARRFFAEDSETSYNNWRGHLGAFYGWSVGNKLFAVHGLELRRHQAIGNFARGLWLDTDIYDALLDEVVLSGNLNDGIFIELNWGPIEISRSALCDNGGYAIRGANSEQVVIRDSLLCNNALDPGLLGSPVLGEILITGVDDGRNVEDWETGEGRDLFTMDWTFLNNTVAGTRPDGLVHETTLGLDAWQNYLATLVSDENAWSHPAHEDVFDVWANERLTLLDWQCTTGHDLGSTFNGRPPSGNCAATGR